MNKRNNIFFFMPALVLIAFVAVNRLQAEAEARKTPKYSQLEKILAFLIASKVEDNHFSRPKIDDAVSNSWFDSYFEYLDPRKQYFYQRDLDEFVEYRSSLDDLLKSNDLSFSHLVYKRFVQRVQEKVALIKKIVAEKMDFSKDETYFFDREDANWFKDEKEAYKYWRQTIKNNLLVKELAQLDKKNEKEKKTRSPKKTPVESILKARANYLEQVEDRDEYDVLEIFISSLTQLFDPHSNYWSFRTAEDFQINISLSLQGIGATLTTEDGYTKVTSLVQGGPAQKQGELKKGDYIIEVIQEGGEVVNVVNMSLKKVVRYIRGKKGTTVHLVIETAGGVQKQISIVRDEVKLEDSAATGEVKEISNGEGKKRIGYIYLPSFYADWKGKKEGDDGYRSCSRDVKKLIDGFNKEGKIDGLVLDLRGNGGGDLEEAINLSGLFISQGPIVQVKYSNGSSQVREDKDSFSYDFPLLTLVDHSSASASEIFAGAMQDYGRGIILGDSQTHGKGTVQSVARLNESNKFLKRYKLGSIKFTVAKFYRVTGASTQRKGIVPDIIFPSFADYFESGEKDLDNALPWDEIESATFEIINNPSYQLIDLLRQKAKKRLMVNEAYQNRLQKIEEYRKISEEKSVSLNKITRQEQQKMSEKWGLLVNEVLFGYIPRKETEEEKKKEEKYDGDVTDYKLQEAYAVLSDLFFLSQQNYKVAK